MALQEETISQADYDRYLKDFFENFATRPEDHDTKYYMKNYHFFDRDGSFRVDRAKWTINHEHDFIWTYIKPPGPDGWNKPYLYAYYHKGRWQLVEVFKDGRTDTSDPNLTHTCYEILVIPKLLIKKGNHIVEELISEAYKYECKRSEFDINRDRKKLGEMPMAVEGSVEVKEIVEY